MAFVVTYQANFPDDSNSDNDTYEILDSGVLKVTVTARGKTYYYAPTIWKTVVADDDHGPKHQKGGGRGAVVMR